MPNPRFILVALAVLITAAAPAARALKFEPLTDDKGRRILFIRDCGRGGLEPRDSCEPWQTSFVSDGVFKSLSGRSERYPGDSAVLRRMLAAEDYDEVWLFSGGGSLTEGVGVGRALRATRMQVRVPNHITIRTARDCPPIEIRCVSSCTVAFMGGMFRYLDEGASYEVHSASAQMDDISKRWGEWLKKRDFMTIAGNAQVNARSRARELMTHFQNTLLLPLHPPRQMRESDFWDWAVKQRPRLPYTQADAKADLERFDREGMGSAQDILMRIERDAMNWAIADLRRLDAAGRLGPRAKYAINMVEEMYKVSIVETERLSRETMYAMGYLTQDLNLDVQD